MSEIVITKPCPLCGRPLAIRVNRQTGHEFIGCTGWDGSPEGCQHTEGIPESIRLRALGHPLLPGLE